jgi:hypothetical protein
MGATPSPPPEQRNSFAVAALGLAIIALVLSLMPITALFGLAAGLLALLFALLSVGRWRRGQASKGLTITGLVLAILATALAIFSLTLFFRAIDDLDRAVNAPLSAPVAPANPAAAEDAPGRPTKYIYRVEGNYRATQLHYTASNGDMVDLNNTGRIDTAGSELPWTAEAAPEPNGNPNALSASTLSEKGDSYITCTITDENGAVVASDTGRGAYAGCYAST